MVLAEHTSKGELPPYDNANSTCPVIHAEVDTILKTGPSDRKNAVLYVSAQPCVDCTKTIAGAGIEHVVYDDHYPYNTDDVLGAALEENREILSTTFKTCKYIHLKKIPEKIARRKVDHYLQTNGISLDESEYLRVVNDLTSIFTRHSKELPSLTDFKPDNLTKWDKIIRPLI